MYQIVISASLFSRRFVRHQSVRCMVQWTKRVLWPGGSWWTRPRLLEWTPDLSECVLLGLTSLNLDGVVLERDPRWIDVRLQRARRGRCTKVDIGVWSGWVWGGTGDSATLSEKKQAQVDWFPTTLRKLRKQIHELPCLCSNQLHFQSNSREVQRPSPPCLSEMCSKQSFQRPRKTYPFPPLRRWRRDWSHRTWLIIKKFLFPWTQCTLFLCFSGVQSCAVGCVTQQPFLASHSFQLHEEVFCVCLCMMKMVRIVTARPAPYEFLEGAQRSQSRRVGKYYVVFSSVNTFRNHNRDDLRYYLARKNP